MAGADGARESVDRFYLPSGRAGNLHIGEGRSERRFLVSDTGVRYGIADSTTAETLGLGSESDSAPWSIVGLLPAGPALTRTDALVVRDGMDSFFASAVLETSQGS